MGIKMVLMPDEFKKNQVENWTGVKAGGGGGHSWERVKNSISGEVSA